MSFRPPIWLVPAVVAATYVSMLVLELARPLRRRVERLVPHVARNLAVAGTSFAVLSFAQTPLLVPLADFVARKRIGIAQLLPLAPPLRAALAVVLLDYTLWFWHFWNHRVPFLWRFHLAHHVDRDLDASTALRFHFGELTLSLFYRALQVVVTGADPFALWLWQTVLFVSILFHHSNARLPPALERALVRVVVTPRMHAIHHSDRKSETDSNWSSLLSVWDYLHGTALLDVPQERVVIGVPAYREARDVTVGKVLAMPFRKQRDDWND